MQVELRIFKHKKFLLLIADTEEDKAGLDLLCKGKYELNTPFPVKGELRSDDMFNPYLLFDVTP